MAEHERLRTLLRAGTHPGDLPVAPVEDLLRRGRRRRSLRRGGAIVAALASVATVVVVPVMVIGRGSPSSAPVAPPAVGVRALATYHWSALPPAPIHPREDGAVAWDGTEMLVWGGSGPVYAKPVYDDGASYNARTRTWALLPPSPLGPRTQVASVWTGHDLFIWGGNPKPVGPAGALYDPKKRQWRVLPPAPIRAAAQAVWTGREVVLVSEQPAAYNPETNTWRLLPPPPLRRAYQVGLTAVVVGQQIYVWEAWGNVDQPNRRVSTPGAGLELFVYDEANNTWSHEAMLGPPFGTVGHVLWTGSDLVSVGGGCFLGAFCKAIFYLPVYRLAGRVWEQLARGPVRGRSLWTGAALLVYDATDNRQTVQQEGAVAALDLTTNRWTDLPSAPLYGGEAAVWTGDRLLIWGQMYDPKAPVGDRGPTPIDAGLQFAP